MNYFNKKNITFFVIAGVVIAGTLLILTKKDVVEEETNKPPQTTITSKTKTYRNEEWGFEFEYPGELIVRENAFSSYYSKFNLKIFTKKGERFDPTFLINIVLPEFVERSFGQLEKTAGEVIVGSVSGIKYQYKLNDRRETVIILPFGGYRLILGVYYEEYENIFNQLLNSFHFLK